MSNKQHLEQFLAQCDAFSNARTHALWNTCILLFTDKPRTALYRSLAQQYNGKVIFGEVSGDALELREYFGVGENDKKLLGICNGDVSSKEVY